MVPGKIVSLNSCYSDCYPTTAPSAPDHTEKKIAANGFQSENVYEYRSENLQEGWPEFEAGISRNTERPSDDTLLDSIDGAEDDTDSERSFLKDQFEMLNHKIQECQDLAPFRDLLAPLERAASRLGHSFSKGDKLESLETRMESLREDFEGAVETAKERGETKKVAREAKLEELEEKISQIKNVPKMNESLETKAAELKSQLAAPDSDLKEIEKTIQALEKEMKDAGDKVKLCDAFSGLAGIVPNDGYGKDRTKDLATAMEIAIKNNEWGPVSAQLSDLSSNHAQEADNAVRQLVGTLFYQRAGTKNEDLKKLLGCIDKQVLSLMADIAGNCGEANANDYAENASKRAKYCYYGTGTETAAIIREAISEEGS